MANPGEYADFLRAIGYQLDSQAAELREIVEHATVLSVTWESGEGEARVESYREFDLEQLRERARRLRGASPPGPFSLQTERLRTLGQDLDTAGFTLTSIVAEADRFQVRGVRDQRYVTDSFLFSELQRESLERQQQRRSSGQAALPWWRRWFRGHPV